MSHSFVSFASKHCAHAVDVWRCDSFLSFFSLPLFTKCQCTEDGACVGGEVSMLDRAEH
jgi:hypothetical protein